LLRCLLPKQLMNRRANEILVFITHWLLSSACMKTFRKCLVMTGNLYTNNDRVLISINALCIYMKCFFIATTLSKR
jgi:phosphoribosylpyrophosphate synthetase